MKQITLLPALVLFSFLIHAQSPGIQILTSGTKSSLRGLSVVSDKVIWVSGSNGMVGKSSNGGEDWTWMTVKGFEKADFRDIEAFDDQTAIIIAIAEPAYILKTTDGGEHWKTVYENKSKGMFLDAMDFANNQSGIVVGDPVNGKIFIARTNDAGDSWQEEDQGPLHPRPDSGEAFFAASGSNIQLLPDNNYYMVSGGLRSRLITRTAATDLPIIQGKETTGANGLGLFGTNGEQMVIAGGDFNADTSSLQNCIYSTDKGKTWKSPQIPPHGYRSCAIFLSKKKLLACGLTGVDYSADGGKTWAWISREGFHVCGQAKSGTAVFLAGGNGKIAMLTGGHLSR